ncbi:MAG: GSU2403 family nucleotidyltransferase fold protein [Gammaproteobacteria bacterium]|nr:GSU2403 family nucleotidyltransferase fold protein [Gammaproteobacteria bacterium]
MDLLPQTTALLYSELLQQSLSGLPAERGVTYYQKQIRGRGYWYAELLVGSTKRQVALGPDAERLRARIAAHRDRVAADEQDAHERERLVTMLRHGGAVTPDGASGRVLEALERAGVFRAGGVLVGSHAFGVIGNMLGIRWPQATLRTQDMDIASDHIAVGVAPLARSVGDLLEDTGLGFIPVPALDRKSPSTTFKIRGRQIHVDLLTPMMGREDHAPVFVPVLKSYATPLRFLDYLIEAPTPAVVIAGRGILVNVPDPARFALHKIVTAQRRAVHEHAKTHKDRAQASQMLEFLLQERPGDLSMAIKATMERPRSFQVQLSKGIGRLEVETREALLALGAHGLGGTTPRAPGS